VPHPGIASVYDYGETFVDGKGLAYLVMELVPGEALSAILAREGALGTDRTLDVVAQAGRALHAAHERGVIHRDVKPANLMVTPDGRVKVTDFGIAHLLDEESAARITREGDVIGTLAYMAPEQARGLPVDGRADVYAAALVLYECLTGDNPRLGATPIETATTVAAGKVPPLRRARPDLPRPLCQAGDQALSPDPALRPAAADLARRLDDLAHAADDSEPTRFLRPPAADGAGPTWRRVREVAPDVGYVRDDLAWELAPGAGAGQRERPERGRLLRRLAELARRALVAGTAAGAVVAVERHPDLGVYEPGWVPLIAAGITVMGLLLPETAVPLAVAACAPAVFEVSEVAALVLLAVALVWGILWVTRPLSGLVLLLAPFAAPLGLLGALVGAAVLAAGGAVRRLLWGATAATAAVAWPLLAGHDYPWLDLTGTPTVRDAILDDPDVPADTADLPRAAHEGARFVADHPELVAVVGICALFALAAPLLRRPPTPLAAAAGGALYAAAFFVVIAIAQQALGAEPAGDAAMVGALASGGALGALLGCRVLASSDPPSDGAGRRSR
jgi:hypothetical protein